MNDFSRDRSGERVDVGELLAASSQHPAAFDALPGWAGVPTLFGAPLVDITSSRSEQTDWVVAGVPFDGTTSSRPGACEGPRGVRISSMVYSASLTTREPEPMTDMSTGREFTYAQPTIVDVGDLTIFPSDPVRTMISVAAGARAALSHGRRGVFLVGDHSGTFGTFMGFFSAMSERFDPSRIGFVSIDHHFDFGDTSSIHGAIYHGSNSRRISELPGMRPENIAFVGVGDVTCSRQLADLRRSGYTIVATPDLRDSTTALDDAIDRLGETCDVVYVTTDVDVMDASVAPGTGNVTIGGLTSAEVISLWRSIHRLPVGAFDIAEVAPRYDPTGRTAQISARLIFEALFQSTDQRNYL